MKQQLKNDGVWGRVRYHDVENDPQAKILFKKENTNGVPYFKSDNGKTASGSQPTDQLIETLGV